MSRWLLSVLAAIGAVALLWAVVVAGVVAADAFTGSGGSAMRDMRSMMGDMSGMMDGMSGMMGNGSQTPTTSSASGQGAVRIDGFAFMPSDLRVTRGTTITWTNDDSAVHTVTSADRSFDSGDLAQGRTFSHRFDTPGSFRYTCTIHPWMSGTVVVAP